MHGSLKSETLDSSTRKYKGRRATTSRSAIALRVNWYLSCKTRCLKSFRHPYQLPICTEIYNGSETDNLRVCIEIFLFIALKKPCHCEGHLV